MLVAVVGGNLQGIEAAYLAKKAEWQVLTIDRKAVVPAAGRGRRGRRVGAGHRVPGRGPPSHDRAARAAPRSGQIGALAGSSPGMSEGGEESVL